MLELSLCEHGVRVGNHLYNSFACAVSLFSTTVPGLQKLIDLWTDYSSLQRFNFGIKKKNIYDSMYKGYGCFTTTTQWYLKNKCIQTVEDILVNIHTLLMVSLTHYDLCYTTIII